MVKTLFSLVSSGTNINVIVRAKRDAHANMLIVRCLQQTPSPVQVSTLAGMQIGCANDYSSALLVY